MTFPRTRRSSRPQPELTPLINAGLSRRSVLRGGLGLAALGGTGLLSACGTSGTVQDADSCPPAKDMSAQDMAIIWSNWPLYIDQARRKVNGSKETVMPTLEEFQSQTGIEVTYNVDVNDNAAFFGKIRNQLGACEPTGRDLITLTDWMAARMIGLGWIEELDLSALPNVEANLRPGLRNLPWDPEGTFHVPWQSGFTGIAYNAKFTKEVGSWSELCTRSDLKGKVSMLTEMGDTMGFFLRQQGADPAKFTQTEFDNAIAELEKVVQSGQVRRFTGNDYTRDLNSGNIVACEAWSGDVIALQYDNPDIKFVVPEEGLGQWSDNMMVPNQAAHKMNAEKIMNYYYEPEVAAEVAAWVNYVCPVEGAQQAMEKIDPSLVDDPLIFPTADFTDSAWEFVELDFKKREGYDTQFNQAIGA